MKDDEVSYKFKQFETFFNYHHKVKRLSNRQQELMNKGIKLKFIYNIISNMKRLFKGKNTVLLIDEHLIDEQVTVPFGSTYNSDIVWGGV